MKVLLSNQKQLWKDKNLPETGRTFPAAAAIEAWLISHIARLTGAGSAEIDVRRPFTYYGLNSVEAMMLSGDLGDWLGCSLPATLAWDHPTIESLTRYLAGEASVSAAISEVQASQRIENEEMDQLLTEIEQLSEDEAQEALSIEKQSNP